MTHAEIAGVTLIALGALFFVAGTAGLLRFPDVFSRLHALTKADGLGLALTALGAALLIGEPGASLRLGLILAFVALAGAVGAQLIARFARREEDR